MADEPYIEGPTTPYCPVVGTGLTFHRSPKDQLVV